MKVWKLLIVVLALLAYFGLRVERFLTADNMVDLAEQISVNAILAFGMTLTILIGGIDLSVGAVLALAGTVTVSLLGGEHQEVGRVILAMGAGLAVSGAFGAINGVCAARTAMPPFVITLATMLAARGCAFRFNEAKPIGIELQQTLFLALGNHKVFGVIPVPVLVMLAVFALMALLLHRTRFGQHLYAIGGNREAARFTGIALTRHEVLVYALCGMLAGIAGMVNVSRLYSSEPAAGEGFELDAIAAAVIGGTSFTGGIGTIFGTLIGAVIIGILSKGLNQEGVHFSLQYIVKGLVVLAAVYLDVRGRKR
jgi:ribose transport system permease protein